MTRVFKTDGRVFKTDGPSKPDLSIVQPGDVRGLPTTDAVPDDPRDAHDLSDVSGGVDATAETANDFGDRVHGGRPKPAKSKPYLAIPQSSGSIAAEARCVRWGEFKAIVEEGLEDLGISPDEAIICLTDWEAPRVIEVIKVDAGFVVVNRGSRR
jgi:hypothetical protein